jgi:ABC-type arginine transport system permease subunit
MGGGGLLPYLRWLLVGKRTTRIYILGARDRLHYTRYYWRGALTPTSFTAFVTLAILFLMISFFLWLFLPSPYSFEILRS